MQDTKNSACLAEHNELTDMSFGYHTNRSCISGRTVLRARADKQYRDCYEQSLLLLKGFLLLCIKEPRKDGLNTLIS